jgi:predicted HicB family RNase H-like nuclease
MSAQSQPQGEERPTSKSQSILQVRLASDLYEWLRTTAFHERRSMNALVNEALEQLRNQSEQR